MTLGEFRSMAGEIPHLRRSLSQSFPGIRPFCCKPGLSSALVHSSAGRTPGTKTDSAKRKSNRGKPVCFLMHR